METKKERKPNAWLEAVKKYREQNPDKTYKQCLKEAGETYRGSKPTTKVVKPVLKRQKPKTKLLRKKPRQAKVALPPAESSDDSGGEMSEE